MFLPLADTSTYSMGRLSKNLGPRAAAPAPLEQLMSSEPRCCMKMLRTTVLLASTTLLGGTSSDGSPASSSHPSPAAAPASCAKYDQIHTGCEVGNQTQKLPSCASISLVANSTHRSSPPWGQRFMYDTGGRTISTLEGADVNGCALQCVRDGPACQGFTLASTGSLAGTCHTVNDTSHTVATGLAVTSYNMTRSDPECAVAKVHCQAGDGKALAPWGSPRPVAAGGGLAQCQQYCDIAETTTPGSCAAVVYQVETNGLALCSLVNTSAPTVDVLVPQQTYKRRARSPLSLEGAAAADNSAPGHRHAVTTWLVDSSTHVFEAARPWQTAFCPATLPAIDWAAAPGTFVSTQVALLLAAPDATADDSTKTASVSVSASDLILTPHLGAGGGGVARVASKLIELSQVGLVSATSCPASQCGPDRAYSAELGPGTNRYPDVLQPL